MKVKTNDNAPAEVTIYYTPDNENSMRVWRSDWTVGQYHLVENETFKFVEQTFKSFGFKVRRINNPDNEENTSAPSK